MPRTTHRFPKPRSNPLSTSEQLRNLRLAVQLRTDQVKLRRLEWDTQTIALPHISPLPGDSDLQIRTPMTKADLPVLKEPKMPDRALAAAPELYETMLTLYARNLQTEWNRDPYNWLASISAQEKKTERL